MPRFSGEWRTSPTAYVRNEEVVVLDATSLAVLGRLTVPITARGFGSFVGATALADGSRVLVAGNGGTSAIDSATNAITAVGSGGSDATRMAVAATVPCYAEVRPATVLVRGQEASQAVSIPVADGCPWSLSTVNEFWTMSARSGAGPAAVTVTVPASADPRAGTLTVLGQTLSVHQVIPHQSIDAPAAGAEVSLPFALTGWTIERGATPLPSPPTGINAAFLYDGDTLLRQIGPYRPRTDVGAVFGSDYIYSGIAETIGRLSAGTHTLRVRPRSARDGEVLPGSEVTVTVRRQPVVAIDAPSAGATVTVPFAVVGWAADMTVASGTGVDAVHLWAQSPGGSPVFLGAATLGIVRGDVGAHFNEQPLAVGYSFTLTGMPTGLSPGPLTVTAYARMTATGTFEVSSSVSVTVPAGTIAVDRDALRFATSGAVRTGAQLIRVSTGGTAAQSMSWDSRVRPWGWVLCASARLPPRRPSSRFPSVSRWWPPPLRGGSSTRRPTAAASAARSR